MNVIRPLPSREGITEALIETLVRRFYARVRKDPRLGPIFMEKLGEDWEAHLLLLMDFWSSLMLITGRYSGRPLQKHLALNGVKSEDFAIWLGLFSETLHEVTTPEIAAAFMEKAERVARSFQAAMFYDPALDRPGAR
jgi:hemoglobin